jgi:PIN domain nuclease of toxin-antitoxin system
VVVLDAQGLIAFLVGEPALQAVHDMLRSGEQTLMATVNLAETLDHMRRVRGASAEVFHADILTTDIHFTAVDTELAVAAAELRTTHYHRTKRAVSLADCTAAALALDRGIRLATSDPALLALMVDEGGEIQPLLGSDGSLWAPPSAR